MTREQEEVIAAARAAAATWDKPVGYYTPPASVIIKAVRALEESEKPKPKVWTLLNSTELRCSDGRYINVAAIGNTGGPIDEWSHRVAVGFLVRALNLLERCGDKPCGWGDPACTCAIRECRCTCKST